MKFKQMKLEDLQPADYNPRKISEKSKADLKALIEEFGYVDPIIWNEATGRIIGGHQRYQVLKEMEVEEVLVVAVEMEEDEEKLLNVALNKIEGSFDLELLKDVLLEIDVDPEVNVELTGFSLSEIENMMTRTFQDFGGGELDLDDFDDDTFTYCCPECEFHFN